MIWQDAVFAVGSVIFALALIPSVRSRTKPARATSALTAAVLTVYVLTFATLGLWYSSATGAITAAMWWLLWWQAQRQLRAKVSWYGDLPRWEADFKDLGAIPGFNAGRVIVSSYVPPNQVFVVDPNGVIFKRLSIDTRDVTR